MFMGKIEIHVTSHYSYLKLLFNEQFNILRIIGYYKNE